MSTDDRAFFGHPKGLGYLAGTEFWERFSFFAMQSLVMLYMTKHLLSPAVSDTVIGLAAFRSALTQLFGPMTDLAFAAQIFGIYSGLLLIAPLAGAWLGDRVLGRTRTITIGALLMAAGHIVMAFESAFLIALLLLILGGGCLIGNLAAQIGALYSPTDNRRTRAFGIYLMAVNVGALLAPLVAGTLGERIDWHWGFNIAAAGMIIGLVTYLSGRRHLPDGTSGMRMAAPGLTRAQWTAISALIIASLPRIFATAAAQQAYGIMLIWADTAVDRTVFGWQVPVTWILTADGVLTILGVLAANRIWLQLDRRGREPNDLVKIAIGNSLVAGAFLFVGLIAGLPKVPLAGWLMFYLLLCASYGWTDPPAKALIARYAPTAVNSTMFAVSNAATAGGFFLLGYLGRFYEPLGPSAYFLATAVVPLIGAICIMMFAGPLMRMLATAEVAERVQTDAALGSASS